MDIRIIRKIKSRKACIGELHIDGHFECWTLEDPDRELHATMPVVDIVRRRCLSHTAIPTGTYEMVLSYCGAMHMYLPMIVGVPGFDNVRIVGQNHPQMPQGCIMVGGSTGPEKVYGERLAHRTLLARLKGATRTEKILITIC